MNGNKSLTIYTDNYDINVALDTLNSMTESKVIINGPEWYDDVYERPVGMITFINIDKKEFTKIKNRVAFKNLKKHLKTWA